MAFSGLFSKPKEKVIDTKCRLSFAFCNMNEINEDLLPSNCENIIELDLTENNFNGSADLRFLMQFSNLETLILDKNQVQSNFIIPKMDSLRTLSVNCNKIENLSIFINNLCISCPNLRYLSMLNNVAAPSYFNGGSLIEHKDYRFYVVSRLRQLKMLDDKEISDQERSQAAIIFGKIVTKSSKSNKIKTKSQEKVSKESVVKPKIETEIDDKILLNNILPNLIENNNSHENDILPNVDLNKIESFSSSESSNESSKSTKKQGNTLDYLNNLPNIENYSTSEDSS